MILAIDVGGDRRAYGFELVINSIRARYGDIVNYCPNADLSKVNLRYIKIVLLSFMFVENYLEIAQVFKKLGLPLNASERPDVFVIAGGSPISENPEPVADFIDIGVVGEGEWAILDILNIIFKHKGNKSALDEIYETVDCAYVPKFYSPEMDADGRIVAKTGRMVKIRREDPNRALEELVRPGFYDYTRKRKGVTGIEYSLEFHRGCKRRCFFCSYSALQTPYRQVNHALFLRKINELVVYDTFQENKILPIQTNLFHLDIQYLELIELYNRFPRYSSACLADMYSQKNKEIVQFIKRHNIYLRIGIEDFTESGRARLGKPIPDAMIENLPVLFGGGRLLKFFFIISLPWQTVDDIHHFETVLDRMTAKLSKYFILDSYFTLLNYKLSAGMLEYPKLYKHDVVDYLTNHLKSTGRVYLKKCKLGGDPEAAFYEVNILSLAPRTLSRALASLTKTYDRKAFIALAIKTLNLDGLFAPYSDGRLLPNWFIDYSVSKEAAPRW